MGKLTKIKCTACGNKWEMDLSKVSKDVYLQCPICGVIVENNFKNE